MTAMMAAWRVTGRWQYRSGVPSPDLVTVVLAAGDEV
jgi:hypothetical protein